MTTDVEGNAFVVIAHSTVMDVGGIPFPTPLGSQLLLVNKKGQLVASGDFLGVINPVPLSVTARRVVIQAVGLTALTVGTGGAFVATNLTLETVGEVPSLPGFSSVDRKYLHSAAIGGNKVTEIRRYKLSKLEP